MLHESQAAAPAPRALVSRYGRVLKPRGEGEERQQELSLNYEPESDVLALLRASEDSKGHGTLDQVSTNQ